MLALCTPSLLALAAAASVLGAVVPQPRADSKICGYGKQGIKSPKPGATITLDPEYHTSTFEVVYCSGQFFKTNSKTASVWVAPSQDSASGQLLAGPVTPDNKDTDAGYYSYRFNATYTAGSTTGGNFSLSIYETTTGTLLPPPPPPSAPPRKPAPLRPLLTCCPLGYGNPENYYITSQPITVKPASSGN